ncbi:MAG TPA: hypothetical protein VL307_11955, partial [Chitinophagaceae bacterium]|nr:hypothetical protein [Chitinophagaceae bacterium]
AGFNVAHATHSIQWKRIEGIGKNGDGISSFPVTAAVALDSTSPCLQYHVITSSKDSLQISWYFSPTLNFLNAPEGLRFAVSVDDEAPQVMALNKDDNGPAWNNWVASNTIIKTSLHYIAKPGKHIIKYWLVDPGIVLQHIVGRFRPAAAPTYLAPPVTY